MNDCFSIYHTSWITSGPKSIFICEKIATKAILFFFGCSKVNSTWLITSELANQRARKVLFTCVVYTKYVYVFVCSGNIPRLISIYPLNVPYCRSHNTVKFNGRFDSNFQREKKWKWNSEGLLKLLTTDSCTLRTLFSGFITAARFLRSNNIISMRQTKYSIRKMLTAVSSLKSLLNNSKQDIGSQVYNSTFISTADIVFWFPVHFRTMGTNEPYC